MKKLLFTEFSYENGELVLPLGTGRNVLRVELKLSVSDGQGKILVRYAQNGVLDVLVPYGSLNVSQKQIYQTKNAVCATHLFIKSEDTDARVEAVTIWEEEESSAPTYPHYVDTDLGAVYSLSSLKVTLDTEAEVFYTLYTSEDGQHFSHLIEKKGGVPDPAGDIFDAAGREARFVRVLLTYHSAATSAPSVAISFEGERLIREAAAPVPIEVPDFEDTPYALPITKEETLATLYGIVERRLGAKYTSWFLFDILPADHHDFFVLCDDGGKIRIEGSSGVCVAAGLNHYLKYYCKVHLSQVGDQVKMPLAPISVGKRVRKETKAGIRYAYNACVHSYTMAFWDEAQWQKEIDLLALSGVNVVFDSTAIEEVWRRFLAGIGYSHDEIKRLLSGPAYYAWQWVGNQMGQGGPLPDGWFARRTEMARKNHRTMRALGMETVLLGYSGMVPTDIAAHDPDVRVVPQGFWCAFARPSLLRPDHSCFDRYAVRYYEILEKVFGKNRYFTDTLFHEGGNRADLSERGVAKHMIDTMRKVHPDAVWVITSWQRNPTSELLAGIGDEREKHALVLDLYAEKAPNYKNGKEGSLVHGYSPEFDGTPWVYCMLNNFGGRLGLHGHLDNLAKGIPAALNHTAHCAGIGMTPEASENNPVLYDFLFDAIWQNDARELLPEIDLPGWLHAYAERRYGVKSTAAEEAWDILADTVYKGAYNMKGQGAPESVTNARPGLTINAASTWGNSVIDYDKNALLCAYDLFVSCYDEAKESAGYLYDLAALSLQILANKAQDLHSAMAEAFRTGNKTAFAEQADCFLALIRQMDEAACVSPYFRLSRWTDMARALAEKTGGDDFTERIFLFNARALITTWGSYHPSEKGLLHDYSNRTWSGLLGGLYYDRWEKWITERKKELDGAAWKELDFFRMEWLWTWDQSGH